MNEMSFASWMNAVDGLVKAKVGLSIHDLPVRDFFDDAYDGHPGTLLAQSLLVTEGALARPPRVRAVLGDDRDRRLARSVGRQDRSTYPHVDAHGVEEARLDRVVSAESLETPQLPWGSIEDGVDLRPGRIVLADVLPHGDL